jgi:hypothetical protein
MTRRGAETYKYLVEIKWDDNPRQQVLLTRFAIIFFGLTDVHLARPMLDGIPHAGIFDLKFKSKTSAKLCAETTHVLVICFLPIAVVLAGRCAVALASPSGIVAFVASD